MGQKQDQGRNQKIPWNKWKQEDNNSKCMGHVKKKKKVVLRGKFIALQAYHKKKEKSQTNNLTLQLKELQKEQQSPKWVEKGNNKDQRRNKWNGV